MKEIDRLVQIKSNNLSPFKGRLLISEPFMGDRYFGRSVVLLAEHNEEGSFGVVLNKEKEILVNDILLDFPIFESYIFLGGPIDTDSIFYIHTLGNKIEDSHEISKGLYWGGNIDTIREKIKLKQLNPSNLRFFMGYSGWQVNQLETELKSNSWLVHRKVNNSILNYPTNKMWSAMVNDMGSDYKHWTKFPVNPNMN